MFQRFMIENEKVRESSHAEVEKEAKQPEN